VVDKIGSRVRLNFWRLNGYRLVLSYIIGGGKRVGWDGCTVHVCWLDVDGMDVQILVGMQ
jgi:hypothetical protein